MSRLFAFAPLAVLTAALGAAPGRGADVDPVAYGKKASEWVFILEKDKETNERRKAAIALGTLGTKVPDLAVPALAYALRKDAEIDVRRAAAQSLRGLGVKAVDAVKALGETLQDDKDEQVRAFCATALGRIAKDLKGDDREVLKTPRAVLIAALKDTHAGTRAAAAETLSHYGPDAVEAVAALTEVVAKDSNNYARSYAAIALGRIGKEAHSSVPTLGEVLDHKGTALEVREAIIDVLAQFGPMAAPAVPALTKALTDGSLDLRRRAAVTISKIGPEAKGALPTLREILMDKKTDTSLRCFVVRAVGSLGKEGKDAVPDLVKCMDDNNLEVRLAAIEELGQVGPDAKDALPALTTAAQDPRDKVRRAAQEAIKKIKET